MNKAWQPVRAGSKELKLQSSFGSRSHSFSEDTSLVSVASEKNDEEKINKEDENSEKKVDTDTDNSTKGKSEEETEEFTQSEIILTDDITISEKSTDDTSELSSQEQQNGKLSNNKTDPMDHSSSTESLKIPENLLQGSPSSSPQKHSKKTRTHRTADRVLTYSSGERKKEPRSPRKLRTEGSKIKKKTKKRERRKQTTTTNNNQKTTTEQFIESPQIRENAKKNKFRPTSQNRHSRLLRCVKATKDFSGGDGELTGVHIGDSILLRGTPSEGWCEGECKGVIGWFPISITQDLEEEHTEV